MNSLTLTKMNQKKMAHREQIEKKALLLYKTQLLVFDFKIEKKRMKKKRQHSVQFSNIQNHHEQIKNKQKKKKKKKLREKREESEWQYLYSYLHLMKICMYVHR